MLKQSAMAAAILLAATALRNRLRRHPARPLTSPIRKSERIAHQNAGASGQRPADPNYQRQQ